ncbi:MAG: WbqC family protein [Bacteroidales bacterium]|nr:WbqC family protein [Candidatus Egerieousia equi]
MKSVLLSTAYFPPLEYFAAILKADCVYIESQENFQKQTYRTRAHIYAEGGLLALNLPARRAAGENDERTHHLPIKLIGLDYSKGWLHQHRTAITSAYGLTPFFDYYKDYFFDILDSRPASLLELNTRILELCLKLIGVEKEINFTEEYIDKVPEEMLDLRTRINPKYKGPSLLEEWGLNRQYWQVFSSKHGFIPNLSILDLLCHEGPNSISYLR